LLYNEFIGGSDELLGQLEREGLLIARRNRSSVVTPIATTMPVESPMEMA